MTSIPLPVIRETSPSLQNCRKLYRPPVHPVRRERRGLSRKSVHLRLPFQFQDHLFKAEVLNLSKGGLYFEGTYSFPMGTLLTFRIPTAHGTVFLQGEVRRVSRKDSGLFGHGFAFYRKAEPFDLASPSSEGELPLITFSPQQKNQTLPQRCDSRLILVGDVEVHFGASSRRGRLLNISLNGMLVELETYLVPSTVIQLEARFGEEIVVVKAIVRHVRRLDSNRYGLGVETLA